MYLYKSTNSVKAKECILCLFQDLRKWQPAPVFLPGEFHGQRSVVGYSPWDRKELLSNLFQAKLFLLQHTSKGAAAEEPGDRNCQVRPITG